MLNDSSEDLRLLAYGMLDALERNISRSIDKELDTLREAEEKRGQTPGPPPACRPQKNCRRCTGNWCTRTWRKATCATTPSVNPLRFCERVLAQQPQHPQHNLRRGLLLHALGRMDEAEQAYARAQQFGLPRDAGVLPGRAEL